MVDGEWVCIPVGVACMEAFGIPGIAHGIAPGTVAITVTELVGTEVIGILTSMAPVFGVVEQKWLMALALQT